MASFFKPSRMAGVAGLGLAPLTFFVGMESMAKSPEKGVAPGAENVAAYKYVVLGGGNASGYAAKQFVENGGKPGEMCIITEEPYVSYERPALSKAYLNEKSPARLPGFHATVGGGGQRQTPDWYKKHGIEYKTGMHIKQADLASKKLVDDNGNVVAFDKLVVATGARPATLADFRVPGSYMKGLYYLRNAEDGNQLHEDMRYKKALGKTKAVVIGGGYIGMECAAALLNYGFEVTIICPETRLMERFFTPQIAYFYEKFFEDKGTKIIRNAPLVKEIKGDGGMASAVLLKDGTELAGDIIVVGTGARPNSELFNGQVDMAPRPWGGIKTSGHMQSSNPDVYACGDVAAFPLKMYNGVIQRQEHVQNCRLSAYTAVNHIMKPGSTPEYDYLPYFYSRIFDLSWKFYGRNKGKAIFFGDYKAKKFGTYWVDEGKIQGVFMEGADGPETAAMMAVAKQQPKVSDEKVLAKEGIAWAKANMK